MATNKMKQLDEAAYAVRKIISTLSADERAGLMDSTNYRCLVQECAPEKTLNEYADDIHKVMRKWWLDPATGEPIERNKGEMQMLIVSEIAEAMEGVRKDAMDDHLPHRKMEEVEMADALIRILDYCAGHGLDIHGAYVEKMAYNAKRADHKPEERLKEGGKKF